MLTVVLGCVVKTKLDAVINMKNINPCIQRRLSPTDRLFDQKLVSLKKNDFASNPQHLNSACFLFAGMCYRLETQSL